jgi:hypothetical protein
MQNNGDRKGGKKQRKVNSCRRHKELRYETSAIYKKRLVTDKFYPERLEITEILIINYGNHVCLPDEAFQSVGDQIPSSIDSQGRGSRKDTKRRLIC